MGKVIISNSVTAIASQSDPNHVTLRVMFRLLTRKKQKRKKTCKNKLQSDEYKNTGLRENIIHSLNRTSGNAKARF